MRTARVLGISLVGLEAEIVTVEARFQAAERERTEVQLSGLPDAVIRESRSRLVCALEENGLRLGGGRLWLNLAPAGVRKAGEGLDLPLALGAAAACGHIDPRSLRGTLFLGEVGIDGSLHGVPGGLAAAEAARRRGIARIIAPPPTAQEAACLPGMEALSANRLGEVVAWLAGVRDRVRPAQPPAPARGQPLGNGWEDEPDAGAAHSPCLDDVRGQAQAKRALVVAAAGGHPLLLSGPPGAGKSLLARVLPGLLPPVQLEERLEITRVLSAAGRWPKGLADRRPLRAPHHTVSYAGLVGGGNPPRAGEITLAHRGVLFLDELPEFRREVLEALRQPLETGSVDIARAGRQVRLPCRFQLVAAMNPCPCGYLGDGRIPCRCSPAQVRNYRGRISGPLLDRIDLRVELGATDPSDWVTSTAATPGSRRKEHDQARALVTAARAAVHARDGPALQALVEGHQLEQCAPLDADGRRFLARAAERCGLSARGWNGLRRVARTLADLAECERVGEEHLAEALSLRAPL